MHFNEILSSTKIKIIHLQNNLIYENELLLKDFDLREIFLTMIRF